MMNEQEAWDMYAVEAMKLVYENLSQGRATFTTYDVALGAHKLADAMMVQRKQARHNRGSAMPALPAVPIA